MLAERDRLTAQRIRGGGRAHGGQACRDQGEGHVILGGWRKEVSTTDTDTARAVARRGGVGTDKHCAPWPELQLRSKKQNLPVSVKNRLKEKVEGGKGCAEQGRAEWTGGCKDLGTRQGRRWLRPPQTHPAHEGANAQPSPTPHPTV